MRVQTAITGNRVHPKRLIGKSPNMRQLQAEMESVAYSDAKVLITGESGVGKEIVANLVHSMSPRRDGPFIPVNCAGIPETLLESEMFGHVRGGFTGAYRDKSGKLEMAAGGTVFLDEVGEMSLRMQGVFLRFLENGEIQKVGSERVSIAADVRVIAATNRNLRADISEGRFREDLLYRLNVVHLVVPPLRERREDIPMLVQHFLEAFARKRGTSACSLAPEAMEVLARHPWPGNVRQLENVIERLTVMTRRDRIHAEDLPAEFLSRPSGGAVRRDSRSVTDELFRRLVQDRESFWRTIYPLYMNREITREQVRDVIHKGLQEARGNYKIVLQIFNMAPRDYKRFLDFLRNHDCKLSFKEYRTSEPPTVHDHPRPTTTSFP